MSVYIEENVRKFSRYHKYGIGTDLRNICRQIVRLIIMVNSTEDKTPVLRELVEFCEQFKVTVMLAKEIKAFQNFKSFQHAAGLATSLCRQSEGWLKSSKNGRNHPPRPGVGR